jgi:ATP-dependent DNA helicase RecQ
MNYSEKRALELLRRGSGIADASFRNGQEEAIRYVVEGKGRLLVVQRTGWGKSFVYFIATKMLRENGMGPAILISPLLSLMRNQIEAAVRMGVRAATINSDNQDSWTDIEAILVHDDIDVLLISPERLANERFRLNVLSRIADRISLLIVDEAHCISDWGHDFRPHYRLLERILHTLPLNLRVIGTTATANNRVMEDLKAVLGPNLEISRGDLNRYSLTLQTIKLSSQSERLAWLAERLPELKGSGIVYTLTVRDACLVADWLKSRGLPVEAYTGQTGTIRPDLEQMLIDNRVKALVATTALGMGFDKPDLAFVIHYQSPGSVVAYYQQVGRAGRAIESAYGILLSGEEDTDITDWFIKSAFPTREEVNAVIAALEDSPDGLTIGGIQGKVNISYSRIDKTLSLLSLESPAPVVKQGYKWQLTAAILQEGFWNRAVRLTELRHVEQQQMQEYVNLPFGSHMAFLINALNGTTETVNKPRLPPLSIGVKDSTIRDAVEFLRGTSIPLLPRKLWPPDGIMEYGVKGKIPYNLQAQEGRALCYWGDAGWGNLVKKGKYSDGFFSDDLVDACEKMIKEWRPSPSPLWVTCIPSLRHPELVPSLARRIAKKLDLPFIPAIRKAIERPEQKTMTNSVQQARNVAGSINVNNEAVKAGAVLLVDDIIDSGWTMTVAAFLLQQSGSGEVFPLALSIAGNSQ